MEVALPTGESVTFAHFPRLAPDTEFILVYNLVGVGLVCRDTAHGWSSFTFG